MPHFGKISVLSKKKIKSNQCKRVITLLSGLNDVFYCGCFCSKNTHTTSEPPNYLVTDSCVSPTILISIFSQHRHSGCEFQTAPFSSQHVHCAGSLISAPTAIVEVTNIHRHLFTYLLNSISNCVAIFHRCSAICF